MWRLTVCWALMLGLAVTTNGGFLNVTNIWKNNLNGNLCVDPPPWNATCGWRMVVTADPALSDIKAFSGNVTKENGGTQFLISHSPWTATAPNTTSIYCTDVQISGSFGFHKPENVTVEWDCICVSDSCQQVQNAVSTRHRKHAPRKTTTTSAKPEATTETTAITAVRKGAVTRGAVYLKHPGKCHVTHARPNHARSRLQCFRDCLRLPLCQGANLAPDVIGLRCSFVYQTFTETDLVDSRSTSCNFWQKLDL